MRPKRRNRLTALAAILLILPAAIASEPDDSGSDTFEIDRGRLILESGSFLAPAWSSSAWKTVVETAKPVPNDENAKIGESIDRAANARLRFGLHPAPFANGDLPMGLRPAWSKDGRKAGLQIDCLICHGGSIGGQSYVGLGNSTLDFQQFLNAMTRADGRRPPILTFNLNSGRGTVNAGQLAIVLFSLRNPDLSLRQFPLNLGANLPEQDVPAWWTLKKKSTLYIDARTDGDSSRGIMQFYLGEFSENQFSAYEPAFADLLTYVKSLEAPKYPFPVDQNKALAGKAVFEKNCSECHGTYGPDGSYPDLLIPLARIGTDKARAEGVSARSIDHYNSTWFGQVHPVDKSLELGYKAPPLDGVWATAPYLHNGSVPTLYALLKSDARPDRFLRHPSTDFAHYDQQNVGWKFRLPENGPNPQPGDPFFTRSLFDSSRHGLGNMGHTFGDKLSEADRMAVIEYLKTL